MGTMVSDRFWFGTARRGMARFGLLWFGTAGKAGVVGVSL